jgi:hypothetical protein
VANRDVWTVTGVERDGGLLVTPADTSPRNVHGDVTPSSTASGMSRGTFTEL